MRTKIVARRKSKTGQDEPKIIGEYLIVDPRVCHGELTFRGTRVPVETVLGCLARGYTLAYVRKSWPEVSTLAIQEAISLASDLSIQHYRHRES